MSAAIETPATTIDALSDGVKGLDVNDDDGDSLISNSIQQQREGTDRKQSADLKSAQEYQSMSAFVDTFISDAVTHNMSTAISIFGSVHLQKEVSDTFRLALMNLIGYRTTYINFGGEHTVDAWMEDLKATSQLLTEEEDSDMPDEARTSLLILLDNFPGFSKCSHVDLHWQIKYLTDKGVMMIANCSADYEAPKESSYCTFTNTLIVNAPKSTDDAYNFLYNARR